MFIGGRLFAAFVGFLILGIPGAVFGFVMGLFFDRSLAKVLSENVGVKTGAKADEIKQLFMQLLFTALGQIAKADGRVSKEEIAHTEALIKEFALDEEGRQQAINWFQQGSNQENSYQNLIKPFNYMARFRPELKQVMMEALISLAMADGDFHSAEETLLMDIAKGFGINQRAFSQLLNRLKGQEGFQHSQANSADQLDAAYKALGVQQSDSDKDVKRAYRKLMSQHHPDKMIAQGVPEDAIKLATEKSQAIQGAYEVIKKSRKA
ncbi:MAG: co-chaperone DjlA [Pseudomonadales bacterium]|nr:co-chaperone DjlA [Pseudomonadales bacterium]